MEPPPGYGPACMYVRCELDLKAAGEAHRSLIRVSELYILTKIRMGENTGVEKINIKQYKVSKVKFGYIIVCSKA